jgi:hypothetical protein
MPSAGVGRRLLSSGRAAAGEFLDRLWLVTRFGCCVQVFHDYVAEATVVRACAKPLAAVRAGADASPNPGRAHCQCVGPSMLPSFNTGGGDIVVCEHLTTRWGAPRRSSRRSWPALTAPRRVGLRCAARLPQAR